MIKTTHVTYTAVADACADILKLGEKPSIRSIHARTGGSYSTLAIFFRQYKEAARGSGTTELSLSDNLKNALMLEVRNITESITQQFEEQRISEQQQAQEASQLLGEYEQQLGELNERFVAQQSQMQSQKMEYEKQLAVSAEQVKAAQQARLTLEQQLSHLNNDYQQCKVELAVYQERCLRQKAPAAAVPASAG